MNKFLRMMVARGYWEQAGEPGSGIDTGGGVYEAPAGFTERDTEVVTRGLDEMSDLFEGEPDEKLAGGGDPVQKQGTDPVDPPEQVADKTGTPPVEVKDERTPEQIAADESGVHAPSGDINQMPKSWKAGLATDYASLPESVKQEIHRREENFFKGIEARQPAVNFALEIDKTLQPFAQILQEQKATPQSAINYLFSAYTVMTKGTPEQRVQAIQHFMKESGVSLQHLQGTGDPSAEDAYVDPAVKALQDELNGVKSQLSERQRQEQADLRAKFEREYDDFVGAHPDAVELMSDMIPLLRSGMTLQQAYEKAVWSNPVTREKKLKAEADAKAEADRKLTEEKAAKARAASKTTVRTSSRGGGPTAPLGTIDDTMQETLNAIKARG